jgi:hypothetical protein
MKAICIFSFAFFILWLSCSEDSVSVNDTSPTAKTTTLLKGRVVLENQAEHSNAMVYVDGLDRGTSSDSSGNFSFQFSESDTIYSGVFTVYYYLDDFDIDTAQIGMVNGKVLLDSFGVDDFGNLALKHIKQFVRVYGSTDRQDYRIGEILEFTGGFTNLSTDTLHIFIYSCHDPFGYISLFRNHKYPDYIISPIDPIALDCDIYITPGDSYSGQAAFSVPSGIQIGNTFWPLLPAEYILAPNFEIRDRAYNIPENMELFRRKYWDQLHRGNPPQIDVIPNKYEWPHVNIVE